MNKLVNLLNEFEKYKTSRAYKIWFVKNWEIRNTSMPDMFNNSFYWVLICSKEYWFIERLVEEDKIDGLSHYNCVWGKVVDYLDVISDLAVQDYKIRFLIDLLK